MAEYQAQLLVVEAKLAKDPENETLISLKNDLIEFIKLSDTLEDEKPEQTSNTKQNASTKQTATNSTQAARSNEKAASSTTHPAGRHSKLSEADLLAKKKEKQKKKKAKLREKIKEQLDIAEGEKQSWQSFANRKGLKGLNKKSIFASPHSTTGKVGVGTNGIADKAPTSVASTHNFGAKRKY